MPLGKKQSWSASALWKGRTTNLTGNFALTVKEWPYKGVDWRKWSFSTPQWACFLFLFYNQCFTKFTAFKAIHSRIHTHNWGHDPQATGICDGRFPADTVGTQPTFVALDGGQTEAECRERRNWCKSLEENPVTANETNVPLVRSGQELKGQWSHT